MTFKVLMVIIIVLLIFGFWRSVDMLVNADVLKKHTVSIFMGLLVLYKPSISLLCNFSP
jgi:hypothetical protein